MTKFYSRTNQTDQKSNRCIFCAERLDAANGGPRSRSEEHIIPEALGGRSPLVTRDCCQKCNNTLGSQIDAPLVASFFASAERYSQNLKGKKGASPRLTLPYSESNPFSGASVFEPNRVEHRIKPVVTETIHEDGTTYGQISGEVSDVRKILEGMIRKRAAKAGKQLTDSEIVALVSEIMRRGSTVEIEEFHTEIAFDGLSIVKGLAKIALGVGHFFFGHDWTFAPAAEPMRRVMALGSFDELSGTDVRYFLPNLRSEYVGEFIWPEGANFVAYQCTNGGAAVFVSLFGSDVLTASFHTDWIPQSVQSENPFGRALVLPADRATAPTSHDVLDFEVFKRLFPDELVRLVRNLRSI